MKDQLVVVHQANGLAHQTELSVDHAQLVDIARCPHGFAAQIVLEDHRIGEDIHLIVGDADAISMLETTRASSERGVWV